MSTINCHNDKDLEKGVETYVETSVETSDEECDEEEIQLLEDSPNGKLVYFSSPYFYEVWCPLSIIAGLFAACLAYTAQLLCFLLPKLYYDYQAKPSDLLSPLWLTWPIINYILYFTMFSVTYIYDRNNVRIETKALQKLLKEIAEMDLMGDPEAWRRIVFRVNRGFMEKKYNNSIFYSGEQCRWFFVRDIVKPIESGTWDIRTFFQDGKPTKCFEDPSNKKLAERAVANYKKNIEDINDLSDIDEKNDQSDRLFKKFHDIIWNTALYMGGVALVTMGFMIISFPIVVIYCAIFH